MSPLPNTIAPGDPGHIGDHEEMHALLDDITAPTYAVPRFAYGLLAARPSAGRVGTQYLATDEAVVYLDTGAAWIVIGRAFGSPVGTGDAASDGSGALVAHHNHVHDVDSTIATALQVDVVADKVARIVVPACRVARSTARSIANGSWSTGIGWDTETGSNVYDNDGIHDPASNTERLTATRDGFWHIGAQAFWASNGTGQRALRIKKYPDDVIVLEDDRNASSASNYEQINGDVELEVGDWVELQAFQTSGGSLDINADVSAMWMHFVSDE